MNHCKWPQVLRLTAQRLLFGEGLLASASLNLGSCKGYASHNYREKKEENTIIQAELSVFSPHFLT